MLTPKDSDPVERRRFDFKIGQFGVGTLRIVQRGVQGRVRKRLRQEQEDALCAPALGEVVVNDGNRGCSWQSITGQYAPNPRTIALGVSQAILMSHHKDQLAT